MPYVREMSYENERRRLSPPRHTYEPRPGQQVFGDEPTTPIEPPRRRGDRLYEERRITIPVPPRGQRLPPVDVTDPDQTAIRDEPGGRNRWPTRRELIEPREPVNLAPAPLEDPLLDLKRFTLKLAIVAMVFGIIATMLWVLLAANTIAGWVS